MKNYESVNTKYYKATQISKISSYNSRLSGMSPINYKVTKPISFDTPLPYSFVLMILYALFSSLGLIRLLPIGLAIISDNCNPTEFVFLSAKIISNK